MKMAGISSLTIYLYITAGLVLLLPPNITVVAIDIAALLDPHPDLSHFSNLLSSTSIASDLSHRSSITILAIPNHVLLQQQQQKAFDPSALADVLRYHVLLELLSWPSLRDHLSPQGKLVTTLFQTTGRAANDFGSLNLTRDPTTGAVTAQTPISSYSPSSARVLALIDSIPYNVTILSVDSVLVPTGIGGSLSTGNPLLGLDITQTLIQAHDFNVAAAMLSASGVADEFNKDEQGAGISLFIPTDSAFATLSQSSRFQNLPADNKAMVLRFHALHSYYPLGSLQSIVNPVQPTIATELSGAGRFTLNISKINGSVAINTGIVQATVSRTVFDQNPVAIFGVSKVLLPKEFFGEDTDSDSVVTPPDKEEDRLPESAASWLISSPPGSDLGSSSDGGRIIRTGNLRRSCSLVLLSYSSCIILALYYYCGP